MNYGQAYNCIWQRAGLDNIVDFNDIIYANKRGAMWNLKGDMSNLPELIKLKDKNKIIELNKIADDLQKVKEMAKELLERRK